MRYFTYGDSAMPNKVTGMNEDPRTADYYFLSLSVGVSLGVFSVAADVLIYRIARASEFIIAKGGSVGVAALSIPIVNGALGMGLLLTAGIPSVEQVQDYLMGWSGSVMAGNGVYYGGAANQQGYAYQVMLTTSLAGIYFSISIGEFVIKYG